jgi:hypothetical protein
MSDDSPMYQHVWLIHSQAGYLVCEDTIYSIVPVSDLYDVYKVGKLVTKYDTSVEVVCDTDPPNHYPTSAPTPAPTNQPTSHPTDTPTVFPTLRPTPSPTDKPTPTPTQIPTVHPTLQPSRIPTKTPTNVPTPSTTFVEPCEYYKLLIDEFDEFDGNYKLIRNNNVLDRRNDAPQWENREK